MESWTFSGFCGRSSEPGSLRTPDKIFGLIPSFFRDDSFDPICHQISHHPKMMEIIALTVIALGLSFLVKALQAAYKAGIRSVPGPSLARFSRIPNLLNTHTSRVHEIGWDLHNKYGPVVRIGPWHVSVSDPKEISTIYGVHSKFTKVSFKQL
jgi:hypothetical protein